MKTRLHREVVWRTILLAVIIWALGAPLCFAGSDVWKFVIFGDTRHPDPMTATGVSHRLPELSQAIAAEKPELVFFYGDFINGYYTHKHSPLFRKYRLQFDNWLAAMKPVYDRGIPVYVIRGNHEYGAEGLPDLELFRIYEEYFANKMPQNGPEDAKGLTFSVVHRGAKFIGLDQYVGEKGEVNMNLMWLKAELANNSHPFIFVYAHAPAFRVMKARSHPFDFFNNHKQRDTLWGMLKEYRAPVYFCGHDHLYSRSQKDGIFHVCAGNGGANAQDYDPAQVDQALQNLYPTIPVPKEKAGIAFMVVTIDEQAGVAGVETKLLQEDGRIIVGDTFSIKARQ
ncbi:MAG: metallophosphoesterase [Proteobacteria bacterium]|nr:metallophosphoesterase [Pseudomonadota bacterium]